MVILLIKWTTVVMKFLMQHRSTWRAGSPGSWSDRSRIVRGIWSDREIVSWREISDSNTFSQWSDRFWNRAQNINIYSEMALQWRLNERNDVSEVTDVSIIYSTVCSGADQETIKAPRHLPLWGNSPMAGEFHAQRVTNAENLMT